MVCTLNLGSSEMQNTECIFFFFLLWNGNFIITWILFRMHDGGEIDVRACYTAISVSLCTCNCVKCFHSQLIKSNVLT